MKKALAGCVAVIFILGSLCLVAGIGGSMLINMFDEGQNAITWSTPSEPIATLTPSAALATLTPEGHAPPLPTAASIPTLPPAPQATPLATDIPYQAVVQIIALAYEDGDLQPQWSGSGTIIDPRGFILTNAHVALPGDGERVDALEILLTERDDQPPVAKYFAHVVQADPDLDLAVLRIVSDLDGNPIDAAHLNLPYVRLGDSDQLHLGQSLTILGYPGIGGNTITLTRGEVSGFTAETPYGSHAFIKTSATIAGGNSGGMVVDAQGALVAIPTQLGAGSDTEEIVDCRYLADTNGDGTIDEDDDCVPTGGFINALRPINLAKPLIEAALRGEVATPNVPSSPPPQQSQAAPGVILYQDDFSDISSGWKITSDEDGSVGYTDEGAYRIYVTAPNLQIWSLAPLDKEFTDVIIEVDAKKISGDDNNDLGIICRYTDADHFYYLTISSDGYYHILRSDPNGEWTPLLDGWEESNRIHQGNATNHLRADCIGDTLSLYINGVLVASVRDTAYPRGKVGISASTYDIPGTEILFDNFVIYAPQR